MLEYIFLLIVLLTGCSKLNHGTEEVSDVAFSLDTKAVQSAVVNSTYRILMYDENDRGYSQSGTYYLKAGLQELVACSLSDDGTFVQEDPTKGINGVSARVNLVLVSPGKKCNDDGSFDFQPDGTEMFYVNAPDLRTVGGYGKIRLTKPLYDPRSKISFAFYKKPGVDDFSVVDNEVNVIGVNAAGETVKLFPALRQVQMASNIHERAIGLTYNPSHTVSAEMNGYELFYYTDDSDILPIASGIYAPKVDAFRYLGIISSANVLDGAYLYMSCHISQGGRNIELRLPLNDKIPEMMPQHQYAYKVLVESDYINVVLDIYDGTVTGWEDGGDSSSEIGTLSRTIEIGTWTDSGWEPAGDGDIGFVIG